MLNMLLYIIGLAAAIWVIWDVLANEKSMPTLNKVIWVICALLFSIITAIVYYFMVKK